MELRHLRYFIAVAEELHFGRAALALGISQPPLSQQIQALEQEIGARLFERTNRRVELSEAGRLFLEEARRVLVQVDKAADVARRAQLGELGELKIGFTSSAPFNSTIPQAIFFIPATLPGGAPEPAGNEQHPSGRRTARRSDRGGHHATLAAARHLDGNRTQPRTAGGRAQRQASPGPGQ